MRMGECRGRKEDGGRTHGEVSSLLENPDLCVRTGGGKPSENRGVF